MRKNRDYFVHFTSAVGGQRRAPRRAASAAARSSSTPVPMSPSSHDRDEAFNALVTRSHTDKTWGGSEELQAFCQFYKRDINVYTEQGIQRFRDVNAPAEEQRDTVHVAFHVSLAAPMIALWTLTGRRISTIILRSGMSTAHMTACHV